MAFSFNDNTGTVVPETSALLTGTENEYRAAFGSDLDVSSDSPQGTLIAAETLARTQVVQGIASAANQINPNLSEGQFLDAIWALTGGARSGAANSIFAISPTVTGVAGTIIPAGSIASNTNGDRFVSTSAFTIPPSGTGQVAFRSESTGQITAPVGSLNQIVSPVIGWETINNTGPATPGRTAEADSASRVRRRDTIGLNARSGPAAVVAALRNVSGVLSVSYRQNIFELPQVIDSVLLPPHSVYASVDGGTDAEVAAALQLKIAGGQYVGSNLVQVTDTVSGQVYPIRFDRPTEVAIVVRVTASVPSTVNDPLTAIRASVLSYAAGTIGNETGLIQGTDVAPFEIGSAINSQNPDIFVQNVEVAIKPLSGVPVYSNAVIPILINQKATILEADITAIFS